MTTRNTPHYDVVIAGARCAGAATALLLARQGARVLLLDRSRYGTDTLSTHALMRGAVLQLHRWGLLPASSPRGPRPFGRQPSICRTPSRPSRSSPGTVSRRCMRRAAASWTRSWPMPRAAPARTCGSVPRSPACGATGPGG